METQEVDVRILDVSHNGTAIHVVLYLLESPALNDITEGCIRQFTCALLGRMDYPSVDTRDAVSQIKSDLELLFGPNGKGAIRIPKIEVSNA